MLVPVFMCVIAWVRCVCMCVGQCFSMCLCAWKSVCAVVGIEDSIPEGLRGIGV